MVWVRIDDHFSEHPKVAQAGPLASWLYTSGLCYCNRQLTDGFIPRAMVSRLADFSEIEQEGAQVDAHRLAERLVAARLWEPCEGGYIVHDYLTYNPSKAEVEADRESAKRRRATSRQPDGSMAEAYRERTANVPRTCSAPVPVPVPVPDPIATTTTTPPTDPLVAQLFGLVEAAGIMVGGRLQNDAWLELLEVSRDPALLTEAFQEAAKQPRQPNVGYIRSIMQASLAEGRRPGQRIGGGNGHGPPGKRKRGDYVAGIDPDMQLATAIALEETYQQHPELRPTDDTHRTDVAGPG